MSQQSEEIRDATDRLDAAGNVTKAITKVYLPFSLLSSRVDHCKMTCLRGLEQGYSIGSAALACFLLFGAFMDEFSQYAGVPFRHVDIAVPEVGVAQR